LQVINIGGEYSPHFIDIMAAGIVLLMSVLLSLGVRESAWFISGGRLGGWAKGVQRQQAAGLFG